MAIIRYSPYREFSSLQEEMNRLFDSFTKGSDKQSITEGAWVPSVDIYETKDEIVIDAEIPGVTQKDINVTVTDNILTIKGEKKGQKEIKEENFHRVERLYGVFVRSFTLPAGVRSEEIKATFKDGVLKIALPKKEADKGKQIQVKVE